jgi:hypothetical protein
MDDKIYNKIIAKKEFSMLPKKDVGNAFEKFNYEKYPDYEKVKLTRNLLRKVFGAFSGRRLFSRRLKDSSWILNHHISTKERAPYYNKIYQRLLINFNGTIFDLGCGVNGFSYYYFPNKIRYIGIEAIGQFVNLTNDYFKQNKINGKIYHESLFETKRIKEIIEKYSGEKIVFLFKVIDSLEVMERDYSKKLLNEIIPKVDKFVISFATRSLYSKKKFKTNKKWLIDFIKSNFKIIDDFAFGFERYLVLEYDKI